MAMRIEARREVSRTMLWATPPLSVAATVVAGLLLFWGLGYAPGPTLWAFFISPLTTVYGLSELALKAAPLIMIATGLALGFRANVWNIGAEGQLTIGAICGGAVGLLFWGSEGWWTLPLMILAGILGGMLWAAIPAFLKARLEVNEILTSLMLTYVATLLLSLLVHGPLKDPDGFNFPQSRMFGELATMPIILDETRLNISAPLALVVAVAGWLILTRTMLGFAVRTVGQAPAAARYAGFDRRKIIWFTMLLGGGLSGLAGVAEVAGPIGQLIPVISPGYGFTAIIVAFLGRLHPLGIIAAGLLVALSYIGGENAQVEVGLPQAATGLFQGMLLFFLLASDFLVRFRIRTIKAVTA